MEVNWNSSNGYLYLSLTNGYLILVAYDSN